MRFSLAACLCLAASVLGPPSLWAGTTQTQAFDGEPSAEYAGVALPLRGATRYSYMLWDLYDIGLYVGPEAGDRVLSGSVPKHLELRYLRDIDRGDFVAAATAVLERNLGKSALSAIRERVATFHAAFRDVAANDRYVLSYRPGKGTTLLFNGRIISEIEGADFAAAYFGIWLGPAPLDEDMKAELLADRKP